MISEFGASSNPSNVNLVRGSAHFILGTSRGPLLGGSSSVAEPHGMGNATLICVVVTSRVTTSGVRNSEISNFPLPKSLTNRPISTPVTSQDHASARTIRAVSKVLRMIFPLERLFFMFRPAFPGFLR